MKSAEPEGKPPGGGEADGAESGRGPGDVANGNGPANASNQWLAFLNLGWLIALNMLVFAGGGIWLDRRWRTAPWLMVAGVFLGICGSAYTVYRAVKKLESGEYGKSRK